MEYPKIDSIFKIMLYRYKRHDRRKLRYPAFPVQGHEEIYFRTLEEVEAYIREQASLHSCDGTPDYQDDSFIDIYAYVVSSRAISWRSLDMSETPTSLRTAWNWLSSLTHHPPETQSLSSNSSMLQYMANRMCAIITWGLCVTFDICKYFFSFSCICQKKAVPLQAEKIAIVPS